MRKREEEIEGSLQQQYRGLNTYNAQSDAEYLLFRVQTAEKVMDIISRILRFGMEEGEDGNRFVAVPESEIQILKEAYQEYKRTQR